MVRLETPVLVATITDGDALTSCEKKKKEKKSRLWLG